MHNVLKYKFILFMGLFFSANAYTSALSTMTCKILVIADTDIVSNQSEYDHDIKYNFQFEHKNQIISATVGVIRPEHKSILLNKPAKEISRFEVMENAYIEYGRILEEELFYDVRLIYTQNGSWIQHNTKLTFWAAEFPSVLNSQTLFGFWSMATDEELFTITLLISPQAPTSDEYDLLATDIAIDIVNQIIDQCQIQLLSDAV
ncbi:hypothetical protein ACED29_09135 [Shewanella sp. 5S214]|uniref:hypothetical protein n=1 Tax=Shewanella sp. 5S214 TaxID=3229999 RepID=UPI00352DC4F7